MIGKILRHRYKIIEKLADGGFGETYLAEDLDIPANPKPKCVVKRLQPQMINPEVLRLFDKEGETLYRLGQNHNKIPKLFAYFQEDQEFYLIQEFIDGNDLKSEINLSKPWSEIQVKQLLQELLEVLEYVHQNNVIHRDIKPENIMRRRHDGKLILIDFGAVKQISTLPANNQSNTSRTVAIGTAGYMPSEQAQGKPKFSSDIYAFGMTAIQLLTGVEPHLLPEDNKGEVIWRNRIRVSDFFAEFLTKMVQYDYRSRYANATEALQALNSSVVTAATMRVSPTHNPVLTKIKTIWKPFVGFGIVAVVTIGSLKLLPLLSQLTSILPVITVKPTPSSITIPKNSVPAKQIILLQPTTSIPVITSKPTLSSTTIPKKSVQKITIADAVGSYSGKGLNKNDGQKFNVSLDIKNKSSAFLYFSDGFDGGFDNEFSLNNNGEFKMYKYSTTMNINSTFAQDWQVLINAKFIDLKTIKATYQLIPIKDNPFSNQYGEITLSRKQE
jgi:serine/threonine protein kinase